MTYSTREPRGYHMMDQKEPYRDNNSNHLITILLVEFEDKHKSKGPYLSKPSLISLLDLFWYVFVHQKSIHCFD